MTGLCLTFDLWPSSLLFVSWEICWRVSWLAIIVFISCTFQILYHSWILTTVFFFVCVCVCVCVCVRVRACAFVCRCEGARRLPVVLWSAVRFRARRLGEKVLHPHRHTPAAAQQDPGNAQPLSLIVNTRDRASLSVLLFALLLSRSPLSVSVTYDILMFT